MILPTMNSEELVREILKDYPVVMSKAFYATEKLRRPALKSRNKYVQRIYDYESKNRNKWVIICDYYVKDPSFVVVVHFLDNWGFQAIMVEANQRSFVHYSGHFLERYNERFLKQPEMTKLELLKKYLSKNAVAYTEFMPNNEKHQKSFFGRSREGIGLGYVEYLEKGTINHFKTFLANDMIFESQQASFDAAGMQYKQYWDEVYKKRNQDAFD